MVKIISNNTSDYPTFAPFRRNIQCLICGKKVDIQSTSCYMCREHLYTVRNMEDLGGAYRTMVRKYLWIWSFTIIWIFLALMGIMYMTIVLHLSSPGYVILGFVLMVVPLAILLKHLMDDKFEALTRKLYADLNPETTGAPGWYHKLASSIDFNNLYRRMKYHRGRLTMIAMLWVIPMAVIQFLFMEYFLFGS